MMKRFGWVGLSLCLAAQGAHATTVIQPGQTMNAPGAPASRGTPLRVQVNYQLVVPMNRDSIEDQKAAILSTQGTLYAMAAQECDQLRAVIPGDCRMLSLNLNNGNQFYNPQNQFMSFAANVTLELVPQIAEPAPAH